MNYLNLYCDLFNLKIKNSSILDNTNTLIGYLDKDEKYVKFINQKNSIKTSDFLLLYLEKINVHN
jgi:hypothetical protein